MKRKKLGEILYEKGHISLSDLSKAVEEQQGKLIHLGEFLLERELVAKKDLISALEHVTRTTYVDCAKVYIDPPVLKMIPRSVAERFSILPIREEAGRLVVIMAEPQDLLTIDNLRFTSGKEISPRLGFRNEIQDAITGLYDAAEAAQPEALQAAEAAVEEEEPQPEMEFVSTSQRQANREALVAIQGELQRKRSPAVRLVSEILLAAMEKQASDIHIEPQSAATSVRIRVDGVLRDLRQVPRSVQNSLVSRIKIISDMDIADRRTPQDGRFLVKIGPRKIDLRVSTLPTQYGEKVVMRLLESDAPMRSLHDLGLSEDVESAFREVLSRPQGIILVTGPTGSGKSTTLYAALNLIRKPTINIVTIEDPVEYVLAGINQVHVNTKAGLTFASCLRSILRQDPNVIMVGEIRDRETAEIAMKAAQTGHLVLSTLHTNDAVSAVVRLLDLDIAGFMIASSVTAIMAQRLVRKLCTCCDEVAATPGDIAKLNSLGLTGTIRTLRVPVGCSECDQTGYNGRVGLYEILVFDDPIRQAARSNMRNDELRTLVRTSGIRMMLDDAMDKIRLGLTNLDEVLRVLPPNLTSVAVQCPACFRPTSQDFKFCPHCGKSATEGEDQQPLPIRRERPSRSRDRLVQA